MASADEGGAPETAVPVSSGAPRVEASPSIAKAISPLTDPGPIHRDADALASRHGLSFTASDILAKRGHQPGAALEEFLDPKLSRLTSPDGMVDREAFADRVAFGVRKNEKFAVFGDYDCDGITATAIVTSALRALGGDVVPLLATRTEGAYGFSQPALKRVRASGASCLITCDCGSSDHERIRDAAASDIDTLVIDHHLVPEETLPARAFLNPHRPDCGFPYKGLASCGLALSVAAALRKKLDKPLDVRVFLDLVAIGTIADVAPLDGDNRALVRAGLKAMSISPRPGLRALAALSKFDLSKGVVAEDIGFRIAPRLNAPGRLGDPDDSLALLLTDDPVTAGGLAASLEQAQTRRRALQAEMVTEALADIEAGGLATRAGIVIAREGWHPGIVGIIAGKIAEQFGKPTIAIALEGATGRGSVRGPKGFPLHDALTLSKDALRGFGGHQAAAGVHVDSHAVGDLRDAWDAACKSLRSDNFHSTTLADARIDPRDELGRIVRDIERMEPCGETNPAPVLFLPQAKVRAARNLKGHLKLDLEHGREMLSAIYFWNGELAPSLVGRSVDLQGTLRRNTFQGGYEITVGLLGTTTPSP